MTNLDIALVAPRSVVNAPSENVFMQEILSPIVNGTLRVALAALQYKIIFLMA